MSKNGNSLSASSKLSTKTSNMASILSQTEKKVNLLRSQTKISFGRRENFSKRRPRSRERRIEANRRSERTGPRFAKVGSRSGNDNCRSGARMALPQTREDVRDDRFFTHHQTYRAASGARSHPLALSFCSLKAAKRSQYFCATPRAALQNAALTQQKTSPFGEVFCLNRNDILKGNFK